MKLKALFMLFWSLSSGFGIIFAILSWIYDLMSLTQDPLFQGFKGCAAILVGTAIGITHYQLSSGNSTIVEKVGDHIATTARGARRGCELAAVSVETTYTISSEPSQDYIPGSPMSPQ